MHVSGLLWEFAKFLCRKAFHTKRGWGEVKLSTKKLDVHFRTCLWTFLSWNICQLLPHHEFPFLTYQSHLRCHLCCDCVRLSHFRLALSSVWNDQMYWVDFVYVSSSFPHILQDVKSLWAGRLTVLFTSVSPSSGTLPAHSKCSINSCCWQTPSKHF